MIKKSPTYKVPCFAFTNQTFDPFPQNQEEQRAEPPSKMCLKPPEYAWQHRNNNLYIIKKEKNITKLL